MHPRFFCRQHLEPALFTLAFPLDPGNHARFSDDRWRANGPDVAVHPPQFRLRGHVPHWRILHVCLLPAHLPHSSHQSLAD